MSLRCGALLVKDSSRRDWPERVFRVFLGTSNANFFAKLLERGSFSTTNTRQGPQNPRGGRALVCACIVWTALVLRLTLEPNSSWADSPASTPVAPSQPNESE